MKECIEVLSLKNDIVFKELFAKKGNEDLLLDFLSALLEKNITKIEIRKDVTLDRSVIDEKYGVLDICAWIDEKEIVNVEMQVVSREDLDKRLEYYASKLTARELKLGEDYRNIKPVIVVALLDFDFLPYEDYVSKASVSLDKHREYILENMHKYYIIELKKFMKKRVDLNNILDQWLTFIDRENIEGVKKAMENNEKIKKAEEELEYLTGDEEIRRRAELRQKYILDTNSIKYYAQKEGLEEGIKEGKREGKREEKIKIIKNLLKINMPIEEIAKVVEITVEEVKQIIK